MYLVAIAWLYVVVMMAVAEALSPQGSVLGAVITFLFYGVLPLAVLLYILGTPSRRRARLQAEAAALQAQAAAPAEPVPTPAAAEAAATAAGPSALAPDCGSHAARHAVAPEGKEV
jgi:hypothetical protein